MKWAKAKTEEGLMQLDPEHSNRSYIRFKTQRMLTLFPDMEDYLPVRGG